MNDTYQASFVTPSFPLSPEGEAPCFRREFFLERRPERALLRVTALGIVEPHLNGSRVGEEVLAPGWRSYRHRLPVSTHDVTALLGPGANALGAIVGEGWAVGRIGYPSPMQDSARCHYADRPALFLQLELRYADGTTQLLGTDESFSCATGAVLARSLYDGETHDARLEPVGWSEPGFDDTGWSPAVPYDWDMATLFPRTAEPIRRTGELAPVAVTTSPAGRTIVDFGQNIAGRLRVTTTGRAGQTVTLRHAEILTDGELDTTSLRSAKSVDRYVLRGDGPEVWEPAFTLHGFRYADIDGPFDEVVAVVVHSDMRRTGWLETSHHLVDRLHANTVWSMRGNFVGLPTDCPQRDERLGWTGDINAFAPTAAFLYDVLGSWLDDLAAEQRQKGYVAISFDLLPPDQRTKAGARLAELVTRAGFRITTGFAGTPWVLPALTETGHLDAAYRMLLQTGCPSFLHPVTQGATTVWERWDAIRPDGSRHPSEMTSYNHYALGAVTAWLHQSVGGLRPTEPGHRRMSIAPRPGPGLSHASLRHLTVHGEVRVAWRVTASDVTVEVTVPPGTEATVTLPLHPEALQPTVTAGTHNWTYPAPPGNDPHVRYTLDTPLRVLVSDDAVWDAVEKVFVEQLPQIPVSYAVRSSADTTLRTVLDRFPGTTGALEDAFTRDLGHSR
ncbi:family 78 glycoside hydrolase catalytic domain [Streptomyces griseoloalbus]|uniref:alpha-L-rhamnosidase n=1 Tax=Streptomyces griseoloalbus TaxID=67303 RepID=A0ABV3E0H5_9ACTN